MSVCSLRTILLCIIATETLIVTQLFLTTSNNRSIFWKSWATGLKGEETYGREIGQNPPLFTAKNSVSSTTTVTSVSSTAHSGQDGPGKLPQEASTPSVHSVTEKPKPVHPKTSTGCRCSDKDVTVLNVAELVKKFGQPSQDLTNHFATDYIADKYTILIPTYRRITGLLDLLDHYCNATNVHKIVFIWHNVGTPIPEKVANFSGCHVPFKFLQPGQNVLSDRFRLTPDVETEAVFTLDDDTIIPYDGLQVGFETWKVYKHLMVGFMESTHWLRYKGHYQYHHDHDKVKRCYSSVLTGLCFLHRKYLDMYFTDSDKKLFDYVDKTKNGEDLLMNAVVSNYTSQFESNLPCHALSVEVQRREITKEDWKFQGLSLRGDFGKVRSELLHQIDETYGGALPMPCCHYWLRV